MAPRSLGIVVGLRERSGLTYRLVTMMSWGVILILAVILSWVLVTEGWCIILIIPAILGWALILSWLLDGAMWVRRRLRTAEEELDDLDQLEESGNQVD